MTVSTGSRLRTARDALTPAEWGRFSGMGLVILALNVLGWGIFVFAIQPHHFRYAGLGLGIGVAFTAWTLGARHAFDADHISAIDNTTRKLMSDGKRPLGTGFFFALGHSTITSSSGSGCRSRPGRCSAPWSIPHPGTRPSAGSSAPRWQPASCT